MNTWKEKSPPELGPIGLPGKLMGSLRLFAFFTLTLFTVGVFLLGRGLRRLLGRFIVFHFGAARLWSRICLRLFGLRLVVSGVPVSGGSLVANHSSWIDIVALRSVRLIYFVSKAEVANWPGIGFLTRITGTVFIERRRSQAKVQEKMLRDRMASDQLLCFFPEGTSTDGLRVLPFKSSLFAAFFENGTGTELPIQPVSVRYRPAQNSGLPDNFYGWWGSMDFGSHLWDVFCRSRGGVVEVIFHPAISPRHFADRKQLADHSQRIVAHGVETGEPLLSGRPAISAGGAA